MLLWETSLCSLKMILFSKWRKHDVRFFFCCKIHEFVTERNKKGNCTFSTQLGQRVAVNCFTIHRSNLLAIGAMVRYVYEKGGKVGEKKKKKIPERVERCVSMYTNEQKFEYAFYVRNGWAFYAKAGWRKRKNVMSLLCKAIVISYIAFSMYKKREWRLSFRNARLNQIGKKLTYNTFVLNSSHTYFDITARF